MEFQIEGYDMEKKEVRRHSETAGHVFLPKEWTGREVAIILLEEEEEGGE